MKLRKYLFLAVVLVGLALAPLAVKAVTIEELQVMIAQLQAQLAAMQAQQGNQECFTFNNDLYAGLKLQDIGQLTNILQKEGLFDGTVTEAFDESVAAAVVKFQRKYGIRQTGYVGPLTRAQLNSLYGCGSTTPSENNNHSIITEASSKAAGKNQIYAGERVWVNGRNLSQVSTVYLNNSVIKATSNTWGTVIFTAPANLTVGTYSLKLVGKTEATNSLTVTVIDPQSENNTPVANGSDLVVTSIVANPASPQVGEKVTLTATIKNQGNADIPAGSWIGVGYWFNGETKNVWAQTAGGLKVGRTTEVRTSTGQSWSPTAAGNIYVEAKVDDQNVIAEADENNNVLAKTVTIGANAPAPTAPAAPSLSASDASYEDKVVLSWNSVGSNIAYDVYRSADGANWGQPIKWAQEGSSYSDYSALPAGTTFFYKVAAVDKSSNLYTMSNADQGSIKYTAPQPDLVVTDFYWSPNSPKVGGGVSFMASIKNQGNADIPAGSWIGVGYWFNGETKNVWGGITSGLRAGQSTSVLSTSQTWLPMSAGNYTVEAMVDDGNSITESDNGNNSLNKTVTVSPSSI